MKDFRAYVLSLCDLKEGYEVEFKGAKGGFPGRCGNREKSDTKGPPKVANGKFSFNT